ncbi:hypothetical protein Sru01_56400 [Sphaerisporangium rufum]|uniref:CopG family transcriptional regulator n=1 Tax=Sphaerisporangium rufum TaxID=1381558 RepID=A0A919R7G2_9ACTN|nr:hypothetical protein [Sphaerisporangium rufum]GII80658.1 hypothetical protein Sru01_56400 [Sphaerisporangium rufum]
MTPSPRSIRFEEAVLDKLARFVMDHPGLSVSAAVNLLVAEALRMEEHPGIFFRSGPAGRRAVTAGGPDVWELVRAVKTTRAADQEAAPDEIVEMVSEHSGVTVGQVRAAVGYWSAYPEEIDQQIEAAEQAARAAEERWRRERGLLAS